MPLDVEVDHGIRLIWVTGRGPVTDEDLLVYVERYLVAGDLRSYDEVFDLRGADLLDVTYEGLSAVAAAAAPTDPEEAPTKIGILVSEMVGVGISRMYQSLREGEGGRRDLRIFWNLPDLRGWLGLPEE
jgi:hypothetical protein